MLKPSHFLCVDPGLRGCGVAIFNEGTNKLARATYVKNVDTVNRGPVVWDSMAQAVLSYVGMRLPLVIETQIYRPVSDTPARVSAILEVQGAAGALVGVCASRVLASYLPSEWKGTLAGDVITQRILDALGPLELWESKGRTVDHNTIDAIGIGLFYCGRKGRGIV